MEEKDKNEKIEREEVYISWNSPSRLFKKRDREFFTNIGAIVFLLLVILVFAREFGLIAAVLSIVFFIYVTSTVPPEDVEHKITNLGIESAGHFYRWEELVEFWFDEQWKQEIITLKHISGTRLMMLIRDVDKHKIRQEMAKHIPFRDMPEKSFVDNAAGWLRDKIPLEKPV